MMAATSWRFTIGHKRTKHCIVKSCLITCNDKDINEGGSRGRSVNNTELVLAWEDRCSINNCNEPDNIASNCEVSGHQIT